MQSSIMVLPGVEFQHGALSATSFSNFSATATATAATKTQFVQLTTHGTSTANFGGFTLGSELAATAAATAAGSGNTTGAQAGFHVGSVPSGGTQFSRSRTWKRARRISKLQTRRCDRKNTRVSGLGTNSFSGASTCMFSGFNNSSGASVFGNSVNSSSGAQYGTAATTKTVASTNVPDSFLPKFGQALMGPQSNTLQKLSSAFGTTSFAESAFGSISSPAGACGLAGGETLSIYDSSTVVPAFGSSSWTESE